MRKNKVVAMLLAGGQGTRLKTLTKDIAKPALPFGGKYRLIDFPLSNASNSEITDIGILTQYQPFLLNEHIGVGTCWAFNKPTRGLSLLPPYTDCEGSRWYRGTANAIYENMAFIEKSKPDHVLILSGDHIYKMDYKKMLADHIQKEAALTISVLEVPWEEASRFGIINTDAKGQITAFCEKPKEPKSNLASMGIYIFKWDVLKGYLIQDANNSQSSHDFGKDIIPLMLQDQKKLFAYTFKGYWKDVGTVKSYWQANMDLLEEECDLDLQEDYWKISTRKTLLPPHFIKEGASTRQCLINDGCIIEGKVQHSILFEGVRVGKDSCVNNSVLFAGSVIEEGAKIYNTIVMEGVVIQKGQQVGFPDTQKVYLISPDGMIEE